LTTQSVLELYRAIERLNLAGLRNLRIEEKLPWPEQGHQLWPQADIVGNLKDGSLLVIEVDDHSDPARSISKYWPLLHAIDEGSFAHPRIVFVEVFSQDPTFGYGYGLLGRFIGARLAELYPDSFRFRFINKEGKSSDDIAKEIGAFIGD